MDQNKVARVLKSMEEHGIPQMIVSDPVAIFYLTGKWIAPGERLLALYLNVSGNHKLVINKLFPQEKDLGVELVWYDDIEDGVEILSRFVEKDKVMGIDKTWKQVREWFSDYRLYPYGKGREGERTDARVFKA